MTTTLIALAAFVVTMGLLIGLHEFGHLIAARWVGIGVTRFSIGFGRRLWGFTSRRSGIDYWLSAIPLGGYVKMIDEREGEVSEAEKAGAFNRAHPWRRIAVLAAGPGVNVLIALVAYWGVFMLGTSGTLPIIGTPDAGTLAARAGLQSQDRIVAVDGRDVSTWASIKIALLNDATSGDDAQVTVERDGRSVQSTLNISDAPSKPEALFANLGLSPYEPVSTPRVYGVKQGSPAHDAGLEPEDRITHLDGEPVERASELIAAIQKRADTPVELTVVRDGNTQEVTLVPQARQDGNGQQQGYIGAAVGGSQQAAESMRTTRYYGPVEAVGAAWKKMGEITRLTLSSMGGMITGHMSLSNIGGPVTIAQVGGEMVTLGAQAFIGFVGLISLSLAILNLLPLPVLDGGQIVMASVEWVIQRPLPMGVQNGLQGMGMAGLYLLMVLAFWNDAMRLLT